MIYTISHFKQICPHARFALSRWIFGRAACCGILRNVVAKTTQNAARSRIRCEYSVEESHDSIIRYEGLVVELRVTS